jgi:hypothetical protein
MSMITEEQNPLGTFGYACVDEVEDVSGSSKGTFRLASINYPNCKTARSLISIGIRPDKHHDMQSRGGEWDCENVGAPH